MSANEVGWVFTGGDCAWVHGDRFVGVAAIHTHARR